MSEHTAENGARRATVAEAIAAWEAKGPTSLTVALMAEALYDARDRLEAVGGVSEHSADYDAGRIAAVEALANRWDGVIAECQEADPRWILDRSVTTLMTARDELRRALRGVTPPAETDGAS